MLELQDSLEGMMEDLVGKVIENRYRVLSKLDGGSMATVYKAEDTTDSQVVAIKVLREDLAIQPEFIQRFKREAEKLKKLQHGDIVRIWEFKQKGPFSFISMEYIGGGTLQHKISDLNSRPAPTRLIMDVIEPVCNALYKAHQAGIVHCDIKPGNIMLRADGKAVVSDFGIAREIEGSATMERFGTSAYMSPEQIQGDEPTPQMDIYALGVILYQLTTGGEKPFGGQRAKVTGSAAEKTRWEQINLAPPKPRLKNKNITPEMESIILKCLDKNPANRFKSTQELLKAIKTAGIYKIEPKDAGPVERVSITEEFVAPPKKVKVRQQKITLSTQYLLIGAAAIVVIITLIFLSRGSGGGGPLAPQSEPASTIESNVVAIEPTATRILPTPTLFGGGNAGQIAFASADGGLPQIWLISSDGTNRQQLTDLQGGACQPAWSPDGNLIAFISPCEKKQKVYLGAAIYTFDTRTNEIKKVTRGIGGDYAPRWSPDGTQILFTSLRNGSRPQVYLLDLATQQDKNVSDNSVHEFQAAWLGGNDQIIYISTSAGSPLFFIRSLVGSSRTQFSKPEVTDKKVLSNPIVSTDGLVIFTLEPNSGGYPEIFVAPLSQNGFDQYKVFTGQSFPHRDVSLSPDEEWIAFEGWPQGTNHDIYISTLNGNQMTAVTSDGAYDFDPAWRP